MRGKNCIAILLLLIFSIPLVPLPQTGTFLSANQLQEETEDFPESKNTISYDNGILHPTDIVQGINNARLPLCLSIQVVSRQADDIFTPPPKA